MGIAQLLYFTGPLGENESEGSGSGTERPQYATFRRVERSTGEQRETRARECLYHQN